MKLSMFAIFDSKAGAYNQPFFHHSRGTAIREFGAAAADKSTMVGQYPEDFSLVEFAEFDQESGKLHVRGNPENLGNGVSLRDVASGNRESN